MKAYMIIMIIVATAFIPEALYVIQLFRKRIASAKLIKMTLRVNAVILLLGLALISISVLYEVNYLRYKAPMIYAEHESINWSDFRAIKRPRQTLNGSQNFAFIASEMVCEIKEDYFLVNTLFHPARSYTFSEETAGDQLLLHELNHLHITEYWSRKLRKDLSKLDRSASRAEIDQIIAAALEAQRAMQHDYDDETYHGYVLGKQRAWQTRIDGLLTSLEDYSNPLINRTKNKPQ